MDAEMKSSVCLQQGWAENLMKDVMPLPDCPSPQDQDSTSPSNKPSSLPATL